MDATTPKLDEKTARWIAEELLRVGRWGTIELQVHEGVVTRVRSTIETREPPQPK